MTPIRSRSRSPSFLAVHRRGIQTRFEAQASKARLRRYSWSTQLAELAIATVSGDGRQADKVLAAALSYIESHSDGARITDVSTELIQL